MVHRNPETASAALRRLWRSIQQNLLAVMLVAAAPAAAGVAGADLGTVAVVGGQAAAAAGLAYIHNLIRPGVKLPEIPARAGRTLFQNIIGGVLVAAITAAAEAAPGGDLRQMGWMAAQAAAATVIAYLYNLVRPLKTDDGDASTPV